MSDNQVLLGDRISSTSSDYEVQTILGCGTFGLVSKCRKIATNETVAVKVLINETSTEEAQQEALILQKIQALNSDKFNIVRLNDSFSYGGHYCLEFEKLDISLYEFLEQNNSSLQLKEIRPIVQQLVTALDFLKSVGVAHDDLKPENIMMVDHVRQPLRVKVIDFGLACDNPKAWIGATVQTQWYRAPEVLLGVPFDEAIDVWSLGCIAAEMFIGTPLFPGTDEYDMMRHIFYTIGKPADHLLNAGMYTNQFFCAKYRGALDPPLWSFMSSLEVGRYNCTPRTITSLNALLVMSGKLSGEDAHADESDRAAFVDLLEKMLKVDPAERITPSQILQHRFLTMSHLVGSFDGSSHVKSCVELMNQGVSSKDSKDAANSPDHHRAEGHPAGLSDQGKPFLQKSPAKRKRGADDDEKCCNKSPDTTPPKRRRTESLDAAATKTGGQTSLKKSLLLKRKRDEDDQCEASEDTSPTKKRRSVNLNTELADCVKKVLSNTKEARSSSSQDKKLKKRKRADEEEEEASLEENICPEKRRRSLSEKGEPSRRIRSLLTL